MIIHSQRSKAKHPTNKVSGVTTLDYLFFIEWILLVLHSSFDIKYLKGYGMGV